MPDKIRFPLGNNFPTIKVDGFGRLKFFLQLWGGKGKLMKLTLVIYSVKIIGYILQTIFIIQSTGSENFLEMISVYPVLILAVVKLTFLLINIKTVRFLLNSVPANFWDISVAGPALELQLRRRFKFINTLLLGHFLLGVNFIVMMMVFGTEPIPEGRTRMLPSLIYLPPFVNPDQSPLYEIIYVVLLWNLLVSIIGHALFDFVFVYAGQHLVIQFKLLKKVLMELTQGLMAERDDYDKVHSVKFQEQVNRRLKICIKHHIILIQYGQILKNYSSLVFGLQLFMTYTMAVIAGYSLKQEFRLTIDSVMNLSLVSSIMLQLVIFALQSSEIEDESTSLTRAAYLCQWHLIEAPLRKWVVLLQLNSQKGITMMAAGLVPVHNEIMGQRIISTITLLDSLREEQ